MKKMNKKGFTLIELLAVIVILGVLLAIAVPAVTKYINSSKKSTFITNVKQYVDSARTEALAGKYQFPVNSGEATLIAFEDIYPKLEKGGKTSPYDGTWFEDKATMRSYVIIVNEGTAEEPEYAYYVAAMDNNNYGLGVYNSETKTSTPAAIEYNQLKDSNVVQLTTSLAYDKTNGTVTGMDVKVTRTYPVTQ